MQVMREEYPMHVTGIAMHTVSSPCMSRSQFMQALHASNLGEALSHDAALNSIPYWQRSLKNEALHPAAAFTL